MNISHKFVNFQVIDKYASKQDEENLQPEVVNSDAKSSESEDEEEEEDPESDCRSHTSILEWKYNPDESSDDSDEAIKNDINCRVVLLDVKCTPEWDKYMKRIENANIKDQVNKTNTSLHLAEENKPPWLTHKRNLPSDDESPCNKKIKTVVSLEQIPSTSKETVPILLEDYRYVSKGTDEHEFNNKTAKNTAKAVINQNSPKSSIELQMSVDEEDDNDVIEIVSDSCDRTSNENENANPTNEPKQAKNHESSPSSSKSNIEESKEEAKAQDVPSAAFDELNIEDSKSKADTPIPLPHSQHSNADVGANSSATETNVSPTKPADDVICVEDAEDKNQSKEPAIKELSVNVISIDVCAEESKKNENIHDIPISQSLDNVINVDECVVDNEENQSQEALIDMPLDVIIATDPLAENPVSPIPNDDSSPSNVSKKEEKNPSNTDNSDSATINQSNSKEKTTLDKDDKVDTESAFKKPHNDKTISDEKTQPVKDNEDEVMIIDEVVKTPDKPVNKNDEVIDVEEISDSPQPKKFKQLTLDLNPINLTQIIRNSNTLFICLILTRSRCLPY